MTVLDEKSINKSKGFFSNFFSNPIVGIFGSISSIIGVLLAIYFYTEAKEVPKIVYYVNPVKAVIARAGQAQQLITTFNNKVVESDITIAQIALWNQGKRPVKTSNILKPIVISTEKNSPILEATVRKTSRDIIKVNLGTEDIDKGKVSISWNIFEQNDGCVIQLIYAGDHDVKLLMQGVIEGQAEIAKLEFYKKMKSPDEQYASEKGLALASGIACVIPGILIIMIMIFGIMRLKVVTTKVDIIIVCFISLFGILLLTLGLYAIFIYKKIGPPFGF